MIQKVEAAEKEYLRWKDLSDVIGSYKGDAFREFAQGITFKILLNYANYYLQEKQLMDRYELVRGENYSLSFKVQDYQTGILRPDNNLSGGEKFCICLALALGLSEMASKNVHIDSLFIDEGLGTLDDKTVDQAIQMLKSLCNSNNHRQIGIITHVSRVKQFVDNKIYVEKLGGGYSRITGYGCTYEKYKPIPKPKPTRGRKKKSI